MDNDEELKRNEKIYKTIKKISIINYKAYTIIGMFLIILSFILTIVWVFTYAYDFVSMHFSGLDILMILMALYILSFLSLLMGKFISFQIQILENNTKIVEDNKKLLLSIQEDLMNVKEAIDVSKN